MQTDIMEQAWGYKQAGNPCKPIQDQTFWPFCPQHPLLAFSWQCLQAPTSPLTLHPPEHVDAAQHTFSTMTPALQ